MQLSGSECCNFVLTSMQHNNYWSTSKLNCHVFGLLAKDFAFRCFCIKGSAKEPHQRRLQQLGQVQWSSVCVTVFFFSDSPSVCHVALMLCVQFYTGLHMFWATVGWFGEHRVYLHTATANPGGRHSYMRNCLWRSHIFERDYCSTCAFCGPYHCGLRVNSFMTACWPCMRTVVQPTMNNST